jgi:Xaa-Pro aminopeptidase
VFRMFNYTIQREKHAQAKTILQQLDIDMWMTIGRETSMNNDPVLPLISSIDYTATAALIFTKDRAIALVGHNDAEGLIQTELFEEVIGYDTSFEEETMRIVASMKPKQIAINYSLHNVASDGLSHGLYMMITDILQRARYEGQVLSAENIIARLRGCKTETERERIRKAIETTERIYEDARGYIKYGVTEKDIYAFFHERMRAYGVGPSWQASQCPGVMVGPHTVTGHNGPTDIVAEKGDVMDLDFGVIENDYCSDLQRAYYVLQDGEQQACEEVQRAFDTVQEAIRRACVFMNPGVTGSQVDAVAREYIVSQGYPEWTHGLGHQIGRLAHDGGVSLAPNKWKRYASREVDTPIEEGMIFTLEPGIRTSRGYVGQEEVAYVTKNGGVFLSRPQQEIFLV